jgi:hypothetical protein
MANGKATDIQFGNLHELVAESLILQLNAWKDGRLVVLDGEKYTKCIPPALLAQAIKFLKDNGIDQPARTGNKVDTLKKAMPDFSDDDNVVSFPNQR